MRARRSLLALAALPAAGLAQDGGPVTSLHVPADGRIALTVDGQPVAAFAGPGMPSSLHLSRALADRLYGGEATIRKTSVMDVLLERSAPTTIARIGPVRVRGRYRQVTVGHGDRAAKTQAAWYDQDLYDLAPALAGPFALPAPVVRFALGPARPGEVDTVLPLAAKGRWWLATTPRRLGDREVFFAFAPQFATTVASAAAGAAIVRELGGGFTGANTRVRITHGVERPARLARLDAPLRFGAVAIDRLLVRTGDYGATGSIGDIDASETGEVTIKGRSKGSKPSYIVYVGADALARCSSIAFDKPARRVTLRCAPA